MYIAMLLAELLNEQNPRWRSPKTVVAPAPFRRRIYSTIRDHLSRENRAAVIVGPRQVGKTTLLLQLVDDLIDAVGISPGNVTYFDYSHPLLPAQGISADDVVRHVPPGNDERQPRFFLFDEISRSTRWDDWLKHAVDVRKGRFLVTDSAATLLREGGRESGLGRWDEYRLEVLSFDEFLGIQGRKEESAENILLRLGDVAAFERYLELGGRPEFVYADSIAVAHRRIRADIVDRAIIHDLLRSGADVERVRDLFVYLVSNSGAIFDAATRTRFFQRPGGSAADRRSLEKWLRLLEETMLVSRVDPFARSPSGRLAARSYPKLYATDHGLVAAFSGLAEPVQDPLVRGRVFEAAVFLHLRDFATHHGFDISYLRDPGGRSEIDFVVHKGTRVRAAVEVTAAKDPQDKVGPLSAAATSLKASRRIVVHGGLEQRRAGDVWLAPAPSFLLSPNEWIGGT